MRYQKHFAKYHRLCVWVTQHPPSSALLISPRLIPFNITSQINTSNACINFKNPHPSQSPYLCSSALISQTYANIQTHARSSKRQAHTHTHQSVHACVHKKTSHTRAFQRDMGCFWQATTAAAAAAASAFDSRPVALGSACIVCAELAYARVHSHHAGA